MTSALQHKVDGRMLERHLETLREIGTIEGKIGVNRLAYTAQENLAHYHANGWMKEAGLKTRIDGAGNLYGLLRGRDDRKVVIGSHLDSVPEGGNYDGALGVVMGIEAARTLKDAGLNYRLEVVAFRAEESSRFRSGCIGSKLVTGFLTLNQAKQLKDKDGTSAHYAMVNSGFSPDPDILKVWDKNDVAFYIEPHIEQANTLADAGIATGIVTAIRAPVRYEIAVNGASAHSGATPMKDRKDALTAASEMCLATEMLANKYEKKGYQTVATVGTLSMPLSQSINKVPGKATFCLDVRGTNLRDRDKLEKVILKKFAAIAERRRVVLELEEIERGNPAELNKEDYAVIEKAASKLGMPVFRLPSGAGHDAQYIALHGIPTAMIFVRNANGSHNPEESVDTKDVVIATRLLVQSVIEAGER